MTYQIALEANELLGDPHSTGLLIDKISFVKQGKKPADVFRQYLGRLGEVDNGQIAVFGVLAKKYNCILVDVKLYCWF